MAVPLTLLSVPAQTPYIQYVSTSSQTVFPYPFEITQDADLVCLINGVQQATDSGYTLSGQGATGGGNLTFTTGQSAGTIITLYRNISIARITQLAQNGTFFSSNFNNEYNRIYLIMQQLQQSIDNCLQIPNSNNPAPITTLTPASYANKYLAFDSYGNPEPAALTSSGAITGSILASILATYTAAAFTPSTVQSTAEIAASVVPTNYGFPPGDLRRYGAKIDGATDDTTAINNAILVAQNGLGYVYHPGGTCVHASQIAATGGWTLFGQDRTNCIFSYTGSASTAAWYIKNRSTVLANSSGFGLWNMYGVQVTSSVGSSSAAGVQIDACGYAYYQINKCHIGGSFKYGLVLNGAEVVDVSDNIIDNGSGSTTAVNIWLVDGADFTSGQTQGYTNSINIQNNQLNNGLYNIVDDGGSDHNISFNNMNGAAVAAYICGVENITFRGNEIENVTGSPSTSAVANVLFSDQTAGVGAVGATTVSVVQGGEVCNNFFGMNMTTSARTLKFTAPGASGYHTGLTISGNWFRNNIGQVASIDVTKLGTSWCRQNYDSSTGAHYTGVHNDGYGNALFPPATGSACSFSQAAYLWGDTTYPHSFIAGLSATTAVTLATTAAGTVGFYGKTPAAQTASVAAMLSSNVVTSASFGTQQVAALQEVINVLYAIGIYSTH